MKTLIYVVLTLAAIFGFSHAYAEIYYVDARNGNDSMSGTSATSSATNGPWQSIARVNAAALQPGDQVLFSCGQTWYESLKPSGNGTASAKIHFGSYPAECADKPKITGFRSIPSHNWQPYQGNIWKTSFPQNLIANGSLSTSVENWSKWPSDASQTFNTTCPLSVIGCMNFVAGASESSSLANSRSFPIIGGQKYTVMASIYVPSGSSARLIVREHGGTFRTLGLVHNIVGNNQWQNVNIEFMSAATIPNARLDISVPKSKQIFLRYITIQESQMQAKPSSVLFDGDLVTVAHHPNAEHDADNPESIYLRTTAASPVFTDPNGRKVSSKIVIPDLKLPSGASVGTGTKLRLREVNWRIHDYAVSSVGTDTLSITPNTMYPVKSAGWGFYFYDALWMLDSAGEWFFDEVTQTLYLWAPTNENPGNSVSLATLDTAINLDVKSNIMVENMEIDGVSTGISMQRSANVNLQDLNINNINGNAIFAAKSVDSSISANRIHRTGATGVATIDARISSNLLIENNVISEAGVIIKAGKRVSLPMTTEYSIYGGTASVIANNTLSYIGGVAIYSEQDNNIESNIIENACFNINDCGAIYVHSKSMGTAIHNNLIFDIAGDFTGIPDQMYEISNGIYLDEGASGLSVINNTIKGGTSSIHVHNGGGNTIAGNIFYGADKWLIWQQEDTLAYGGIKGNIISNNQLFPTGNYESVHNSFYSTNSTDTSKFAAYTDNQYSTIYLAHIARETDELSFSSAYTLLDWQAATTITGNPRNNDLNSIKPAPLPFFARGIAGNDFMVNSAFSDNLNGWGSWNAISPMSSRSLEGCLPVSVNCMHVIAGASDSLIHSPKFTITKGKFYRITFDIKTSVTKANLTSQVRFAGPNNYESLMNNRYKFSSSTEWKRHSFIFEASDTASSTTIDDRGARFDIRGIPPTQSLWIANLEIVPFDPGILGPTRSDLLVNKTDIDKAVDCPTRLNDTKLCSNYFIFPEATLAVWPISVPPRSGRIVFTQNITLIDTDGDGIADSQDQCTGTDYGLAVNGKGCSLLD